jgi:Zn-finger nucleic acid-binding protein
MTSRFSETGILCPECEIPLIHIPKGVVEQELAVCPVCGTGGDYTDVVEKGGSPAKFKYADRIRTLLKQQGFGVGD